MGISTIEFFEIGDCYTEDGRGPFTVIARLRDENEAKAFAEGRGNYKKDAVVRPVRLILADTAEDMDAYHQEERRQKALAKLTAEDKALLGLA